MMCGYTVNVLCWIDVDVDVGIGCCCGCGILDWSRVDWSVGLCNKPKDSSAATKHSYLSLGQNRDYSYLDL